MPYGPEIGAPIPEFRLRDQRGEVQALETLRGPRGLVVLFHRSADW